MNIEKQSKTLDSIYNAIWQIDFDQEIVVKAKRKRPFKFGNTYDLDQADWIPPNKSGVYLMASLFTRANFEIDPTTAKMYYIKGRTKRRVSINIDGIGADREGSNPYPFLSLPADRIKYINWNPICACITVIKRAIPRSLQIKLESGILHYNHPGYSKSREFYKPDYSKKLPIHQEPDLRTAIHWLPNFELTKGQASIFSFYAADTPSTYNVRIEGITNTGKPIFHEQQLTITK